MKEIKRRMEQFLFYDYRGIEVHLAKMAVKGWQIHKITPFYWEYKRAAPQKLAYAVTYFSEASEFNPYPTENQRTFHEYCKDAGWKLAAEWAQMQIFCAQEEDPTPIETEESVKLKAIHRAMKKNFLPGNTVILLIAILQIILQVHSILDDPIYQLSGSMSVIQAGIWSIITVQMLIGLMGYFIWYQKSKKAVSMGKACMEGIGTYKKISVLLWALTVIVIILVVLSFLTQKIGWAGLLGIPYVVILIALVMGVKNSLKRAEVSGRVNATVTVISSVILSFIMMSVLAWAVISGIRAGWLGRDPARTYTATTLSGVTVTWDIYQDELPLKVEDLQEVDYRHYSYQWTERESFLLAQYSARQNSFPDGQQAPQISYVIVKVKIPMLFDLCLKQYLNLYQDEWDAPEIYKRYFRKTDDTAWQADEVYQLYNGKGEAQSEYILCWGNQIVYINLEEIPTAEQIAIITEKLSK